jgi:hypothetical protein
MGPDEQSYNEQRRDFYKGEIADALSLKNIINDIDDAHLTMEEGARRLNEVFGQNRQRITEITKAVADAVPEITRLGGDVRNVFDTMEDISRGTQRNIVASKEDVNNLFAASKILGTSVDTLTQNFTEVGIQVSSIGPELLKAVTSIENVGLNVKQVMGEVTRNMDKLTMYNFSEGVNGLAKMAAQASIFKFDMSETFRVADKALRPDGAIELASAFQRMGVAVGELTDPFQLMNMSLNDPQGLQKSLSQMTKQYAEFDEKTKTFKINPAGMLQMRELSEQTGISYKALADSALAAGNLDRALSQTKGLQFASDEDKELLGNIAKMDAGTGEYTVSLKNEETGKDETIKLSELTNDQLKKLLEQQKTAPKSLEEISKNSLDTLKDILTNIKAGREGFIYGVTSADQIRNVSENLNKFGREVTDKLSKSLPTTSDVREKTTSLIDDFKKGIQSLYKDYEEGKLTKDKFEEKAREIENRTMEASKKIGEKSMEFIKNDVIGTFEDRFMKNNPLTSTRSAKEKVEAIKRSEVDLNFKGGTVTHNVNISPNVDNDFVNRLFSNSTFQSAWIDSLITADPVTKTKLKQALGF